MKKKIKNSKDLLPIIQKLSDKIDKLVNDTRDNLPEGFTLITSRHVNREASELTVKGVNLAFYMLINLDKVPEGFAQEFRRQLEDKYAPSGEPREHIIQNQYTGLKSLDIMFSLEGKHPLNPQNNPHLKEP